jgi:hypothetical protein
VSRSHSLYTGYSPGYCISFESYSTTPFNYTLTIEF